MIVSELETRLLKTLHNFPGLYENRYTTDAHRALLKLLFSSLTGGENSQYLSLLFPHGPPSNWSEPWSLREAQGAVEGTEYSPAARGKPCGHIFKSGEATYRCKTCSVDDTCVLCSRCFDSSDHAGHMIFVSISPGNSGCCDCGDLEAWRRPVNCAIHTALPDPSHPSMGSSSKPSHLPQKLVESIRMTIARALDYVCDVVSCSPEQLRLPKTEASIRQDETGSRLTSKYYDGDEIDTDAPEFALVLWNDEKHTVEEVQDQVRRACKQPKAFGLQKATETNDIGRSIIEHDRDIGKLLDKSKVIEQIKVTVTIRSSRDTFREQMCGTIIEWLGDIAGGSVGDDHDLLRHTICEEMLKQWRTGSEASNAEIGRNGIDDHEQDEEESFNRLNFGTAGTHRNFRLNVTTTGVRAVEMEESDNADDDDDDDEDDDDDDDDDEEGEGDDEDEMELDMDLGTMDADGDLDMESVEEPEDDTEVAEATYAGWPPPPPPPPAPPRRRDLERTPSDSDETERAVLSTNPDARRRNQIPKTPAEISGRAHRVRVASHWLETPAGFCYRPRVPPPLEEDLWKRVRLDYMILFDLRLWKKARIDLRDLYISTVVTIPRFKRILGLRFAGLYTVLAQLYLIADREPDHSIINLSLQMLTTPSITEEVVERGNFLTFLMAILYTFLTTRQVGRPEDVNPQATLAFDAGSLTNRRMYHFFMDLKYLFGSDRVQAKLRNEERYMLQFLDLVKLHQGICPNVRAVGDHIEYETDAWISASLITRELNRLCRQFSESFRWRRGQDETCVARAMRLAAKIAIVNSMGLELRRFDQAEIKQETRFKKLGNFVFDVDSRGKPVTYEVVDFVVEKHSISFHHALHYTLSWLVDCAKSMSREQVRSLIQFSPRELQSRPPTRSKPYMERNPEDFLLAMFDFPLRVCAWLAQMKAGMWVRNGLSLRHQMSTYRGVSQRDVAHQRDIFLLQTALVTCDPSRVLASMIDRFKMEAWMKGVYEIRAGYDENQTIDVAEELMHLMIVLLSDRTFLMPIEDEPQAQAIAMKRDIAHVLCFKPLSFSELTARLAEKVQDMEEFQTMLDEMTRFRAPEGLSDSGTFELREQYVEEIDPYIAHYSKNQREEAENAYRNRMSKKTVKPASEVVFEPKLRTIPSGLFTDLGAFTRTKLFHQMIYYALNYPLQAASWTTKIPPTRLETFLQVVLHAVLIAVAEDSSDDQSPSRGSSFVHYMLTKPPGTMGTDQKTALSLLQTLSTVDDLRACQPKIRLILHRMQRKRPETFAACVQAQGISIDRMDTDSPAPSDADDLEARKKAAQSRQARVMAQFQQAQQRFLANQGDIDWGEDDLSDAPEEAEVTSQEQKKVWKYPSGTCILCQEETNDSRIYGTFAFITDSNILRQTDLKDPIWIAEALNVPSSLDRSADDIRPFGVAQRNREVLRKLTADGRTIVTERQGLGKGFPPSQVRRGPVTTGCGHIMHYACFEHYYQATQRRQAHQIARAHPERLDKKEFVCPLCKALGNAFLPIIWKGKEESFPGALRPTASFEDWLCGEIGPIVSRLEKAAESDAQEKQATARHQEMFTGYISQVVIAPLANKLAHLFRADVSPLSPIGPLSNSGRGSRLLSLDTPAPEVLAMAELGNIYKRLRDTFKVNQLPTRYSYPPPPAGFSEDLTYTDIIAKTFGFSIAAVEIAQRGVESEVGQTLLDRIPPQMLTLIRILSETSSSFTAVGAMHHGGLNKTVSEYNDTRRRQIYQLLIGHPQIFDATPLPLEMRQVDPLLTQDAFVFLAECSVCLVPAVNLEIHHITRLCYEAEIIKVVLAFIRDPEMLGHAMEAELVDGIEADGVEEPAQSMEIFVNRMLDMYSEAFRGYRGHSPPWRPALFHHRQSRRLLYRLVASYALPFLRKSVILLHARFGVDFPNTGLNEAGDSELRRLTKLLRLPSLAQVFESFSSSGEAALVTQSMVVGWLRHWLGWQESKRPQQPSRTGLSLSHPGIFELIGLPKHFDTLSEEAMKRRCPSTGKELTDPSICLFCGDIFCSQALCCVRDGQLGGCQQHLEKCGHHIGLYINIRKCTVLYLHDRLGSWHTAPYLDKHGEVDAGLRRNRQLFLNQKRYDALLRNVWLQHGIPTTISRKLEADVNAGGWETI
ncbi:MAG: hypothetical protein M1817_002088 [Caeruleum heppii]|nr:MAG: hypothetical protein M1817_002088 [Caeruleum heppii]